MILLWSVSVNVSVQLVKSVVVNSTRGTRGDHAQAVFFNMPSLLLKKKKRQKYNLLSFLHVVVNCRRVEVKVETRLRDALCSGSGTSSARASLIVPSCTQN